MTVAQAYRMVINYTIHYGSSNMLDHHLYYHDEQVLYIEKISDSKYRVGTRYRDYYLPGDIMLIVR